MILPSTIAHWAPARELHPNPFPRPLRLGESTLNTGWRGQIALRGLLGSMSGVLDLVADGHVELTVFAIHVVGTNTPAVLLCVLMGEGDVLILAWPVLFGGRSVDL
jgi:hypothetical protein